MMMKRFMLTLVVVLTYSGSHTRAQLPEPMARQAQTTPAKKTAPDTSGQKLQNVVNASKPVNKAKRLPPDSVVAKPTGQNPACVPVLNTDVSNAEWSLIFLPAMAFILAMGIILFRTRGFDFKAALKENDVSKITVINPYYIGQVTKPGETDVPLSLEITPNVSVAAPDLNAVNEVQQGPAERRSASAVPPDREVGKQLEPAPATLYNISYTINPEVYPASISRYIALVSSVLIIVVSVAISCFFMYHYIKFGCPPDLGQLTSVLLALGFGVVPYLANKVSSTLKSVKAEV